MDAPYEGILGEEDAQEVADAAADAAQEAIARGANTLEVKFAIEDAVLGQFGFSKEDEKED